MEQLQLPFPEPELATWVVRMFKDDEVVLEVGADSFADAQDRRRTLVELLQRDPSNLTVWEEFPRPSGWYGLRQQKPDASTVYQIIIRSKPQEQQS